MGSSLYLKFLRHLIELTKTNSLKWETSPAPDIIRKEKYPDFTINCLYKTDLIAVGRIDMYSTTFGSVDMVVLDQNDFSIRQTKISDNDKDEDVASELIRLFNIVDAKQQRAQSIDDRIRKYLGD